MPRDLLLDVIYLLMFPMAPLVALWGLRWAGLSLLHYSLPSFLILAYIATAYVGLLPMYMGWDSHSASLGARDPAVIGRVTAYAGMALVSIVGGFVFARHILRLRPRRVEYGGISASDIRQMAVVGVLALIALGVLALYLTRVPSIALMYALRGDVLSAAVARSEMTNNFGGDHWRYELFFRYVMDYCVVYAFIEWRTRRSMPMGVLFLLLFTGAAFSAIMTIEKGPLFALFVMIFLAHVLLTDGRYWQRAAAWAVPLAVLLLVVMKVWFMGALSLSDSFGDVVWRVFSGQIVSAYFYVDQFPRELPYLGGSSFPNPGGLLPFEPVSVTVKMAEIIYPGDYSRGVVGSAPTVFWGEMHANFGPLGVVVPSFWVGVGIYSLHYLLRRLPLTPATLTLTVLLTMHYRVLTGTGLSEFLVDVPAATLAAATGLLLVARRRRPACPLQRGRSFHRSPRLRSALS